MYSEFNFESRRCVASYAFHRLKANTIKVKLVQINKPKKDEKNSSCIYLHRIVLRENERLFIAHATLLHSERRRNDSRESDRLKEGCSTFC